MSMTKKDFTRTVGDDYPIVFSSIAINGNPLPLVILVEDELIFTFSRHLEDVVLIGVPQEDNSVVFNLHENDVKIPGTFAYTMKRICNGTTATHAAGMMTLEE